MAFQNRIARAIEKMEARIQTVSAEKISKLDHDLQEDFSSLAAYQNVQALAFASGKLTQEEASILYNIYGGEYPTPTKWAKQPLAARIVATQTAGELLSAQLAARRRTR